jgi:TonB family protein
MKNILAILSVCALLLSGAFAQNEDDGSAIWAYQRYQEAMGGSEIEPVITYAKMAYERALEEWGEEKKETGLIASNYGDALLRGRQSEQAIELFQHCEANLVKFQPETKIDLAICQLRLGQIYRSIDDRGDSERAFLRMVETLSTDQESASVEISSLLGEAYLGLAQVSFPQRVRLRKQEQDFSRRTEKSKRYLELAHPHLVAAYGENHHSLGTLHYLYGLIYESARNWEEAAEAYKRSYDIRKNLFGDEAPVSKAAYGRYRFAGSFAGGVKGRDRIIRTKGDKCFYREVEDEKVTSCLKYRKVPEFPMSKSYSGEFGFVLANYTISETGKTSDVEIIASWPGGEFDRVAKSSIERWKFTPPVNQEGEARALTDVEAMFNFKLVRR